MRVEVGLLGDVADARLVGGHVVDDAGAVEEDLSLAGVEQADDHVHGGAVAGAGGDDVAEDFAMLERKADVLHGALAVRAICESANFEHFTAWLGPFTIATLGVVR